MALRHPGRCRFHSPSPRLPLQWTPPLRRTARAGDSHHSVPACDFESEGRRRRHWVVDCERRNSNDLCLWWTCHSTPLARLTCAELLFRDFFPFARGTAPSDKEEEEESLEALSVEEVEELLSRPFPFPFFSF